MQADELALAALEQALCTPSYAVPSLALAEAPPTAMTLREFAGRCLGTLRCDVLAAGNVPEATAHAMADSICSAAASARSACGCAAADGAAADGSAAAAAAPARPRQAGRGRAGARRSHAVHAPTQRCLKLPEGSDAVLLCNVPMPHQARSASISYFQVLALPIMRPSASPAAPAHTPAHGVHAQPP